MKKLLYFENKFGEESGAVLYFCNSLISNLIEGIWIFLFASVVC